MKNGLLLLGVAVGGLWLFNKGRKVYNDAKGITVLPDGFPSGFKLDPQNNTRLLFNLPIRIGNTTDIPLIFTRFDGTAKVGSNISTTFSLASDGRSVPAQGSATYIVPVRVSVLSLGAEIFQIIKDGWKSFKKDINLTGALYLPAGLSVPVDIKYSWNSQGTPQSASIGRSLNYMKPRATYIGSKIISGNIPGIYNMPLRASQPLKPWIC